MRYADILHKVGFDVIHRDLKKIYTDKGKTKYIYKCDFDGEIGWDMAMNVDKTDLFILVSGDSDFVFLEKKIRELRKNLLVICFSYKAPWEFYRLTHIFLEEIKEEVLIKKP